jgi:hypothetical protein
VSDIATDTGFGLHALLEGRGIRKKIGSAMPPAIALQTLRGALARTRALRCKAQMVPGGCRATARPQPAIAPSKSANRHPKYRPSVRRLTGGQLASGWRTPLPGGVRQPLPLGSPLSLRPCRLGSGARSRNHESGAKGLLSWALCGPTTPGKWLPHSRHCFLEGKRRWTRHPFWRSKTEALGLSAGATPRHN